MTTVAAMMIEFDRIFTCHKSANPKSDHKPNTYPTRCFRQHLADEDVSSHHALRMHGGQTPVPYGCPYLLSWGRCFMVKQQKHEKSLTFYANKSVETL